MQQKKVQLIGREGSMIIFCYGLIFLSGATGLIYQVVWQKYLSILLGSHAAASSIILALFFLFLALGYAIIGKYSSYLFKNRFGQYALFEFLIGLYALYSPQIFRFLFSHYSAYASLTGNQDYVFAIIFSSTFIFVPTFLMGGTIPVLVEGLSTSFDVSSKVHARIYAVNTFGAFVGCFLAGFFLIENLGLEDSVFFTGWLNMLIGLAALAIIRFSGRNFNGPDVKAHSQLTERKDKLRVVGLGLISFLSGFYVFSIEKLIIRMAGLVLGSSAYSYSIVVCAFILAIGVGSYLISVFDKKLNEKIFISSLIAAFLSLALLYLFIPYWPIVGMRMRIMFQPSLLNFMPYWLSVLVLSLLIFIVPAGLLGTNLPFLFNLIQKRDAHLAVLVGRMYSINCLGAALGATVGGYWLFKYFDADTNLKVSMYMLILAGLLASVLLETSKRVKQVSRTVLAGCFVITLILPKWDLNQFVPGKHLSVTAPQAATSLDSILSSMKIFKWLYSTFDPNTYVAVTEDKKEARYLYVNGKPDAVTTGDHTTRALAALSPITFSPKPVKKIFIAGLGAGLSLAVASKFKEVEKVEVAEISEGVVQSLPYFESFNFGLKDRSQKYQIEVGDAYKVLMSKKEKYDLIICEPSNPWVSGVEKLFSTEFYEQVRSHLGEGGVFAQWFPLFGMSEGTFLTILNTYYHSFPWVSVWSAGKGALTIIGSETELKYDLGMAKARYAEQKELYNAFRIKDAESPFYFQLLTPAQVKLLLLKVEDKNSVYNPKLEFQAGRGLFASMNVDLSQLLYKKAVLPIPDELQAEVWPLWRKEKIPFSLQAMEDAQTMLGGVDFFQSLRLQILNRNEAGVKVKYKVEQESLVEHFYLLGEIHGDRPPELKDGSVSKDAKFPDRIANLSAKVRQLQALGFKPKLSQLTNFLEVKCVKEECEKAKLMVVLWLAPPQIAQDKFSKMDSEQLSENEKVSVGNEYEKVKETYRGIGAF